MIDIAPRFRSRFSKVLRQARPYESTPTHLAAESYTRASASGRPFTAPIAAERIRCFDDEFTRGARARSRNRDFAASKSLATYQDGEIEVQPLTESDVRRVGAICLDVERRFPELA